MKYWLSGNAVFLWLILAIVSCVPVEEKVEAPFDISFQNEVVRNIYQMQMRQEKDSLILYLQSEDPSVRYAAARAFASFQDSSSFQSLLPLLQDPNSQVRAMAAYAVGQLGSPLAETPLTSAFDGRDSARLYLKSN
ncbi:MAG: HEAT repeat domain-containing protein, partial [Saprospiraceae bacterium]